MKHAILIILLLLICTAPVAAITYPQEYYNIEEIQNQIMTGTISDDKIPTTIFSNHWDSSLSFKGGYIIFLEIQKTNILLEQQNKLHAELVKAQWVETCYAPRVYNGMTRENATAWKLECANAGYPVG